MEMRLFLYFLFFQYQEIQGTGTMNVPGGGVVARGTDVVLQYLTDTEWFMCTFFRYEKVAGDKNNVQKELCSYMVRDGNVSQFRCDPDELGNHFEYTGNSTNECTITVKNVTMEDDCQWAVRLATDIEPLRFEIVVAVPLESIYIEAPNAFVADQLDNVTCVTKGGQPKPEISFTVTQDGNTVMQPSVIDEVNNETSSLRRFITNITPKIEDHGKEILCTAKQFDNASEPQMLFEEQSATPVILNVTFPPQPKSKETFKANLGESVIIRIGFASNPTPNKIQWISFATNTTGNGTAIQNGSDKYHFWDLVSLADTKFQASLKINMVTEDDVKSNFYLMATNSLGTEKYAFLLTTETIPSSTSSNLTLFIIIGVVALLILMFISVLTYKKCVVSSNEADPLLN